jgi:hypothetical protein
MSRIFTSRIWITIIICTSIVIIAVYSFILTISITFFSGTGVVVFTVVWSILTTIRWFAAVISTEIIIVTVYRALCASVIYITIIVVTFITLVTLIRDISINTTLSSITFGSVAGIFCGTDYIRNIDAPTARHTKISSTCVVIITIDFFVGNRGIITRSIWVTVIFGTFVIIINWYRSINTSDVTLAFDVGASINVWAFIFRVFTAISAITLINSAWIIIVAIYLFIPATSSRITIVVSTGIIIVAAEFTLSTSNCRVARINFTST